MSKIALLVEYDGSNYCGFQFQPGEPTIQDELEKAVSCVSSEVLRVAAASRTDSGVHARGQVVSFRTQSCLPPRVWLKALNYYLPRDIAVKEAYLVSDDFDVRRAQSRRYNYTILLDPSPIKSSFTYLYPRPLDVELMNLACSHLEGDQDMISFTPALEVGCTMRHIYQAEVTKEDGTLVFSMIANAFLPHQMRHMAGSLLQVGRGKLSPEGFGQLLAAKKRGLAGPALPPQGLCLEKVIYNRPLEEM